MASVGLAIYSGDRTTALGLTGSLLVYTGFLRLTKCRVETLKHRPCKRGVRGTVGTCDDHIGLKRGLPRLVRGARFAGLPMFMWPRDDFVGAAAARSEPQSRPDQAVTAKAARPGYDRVNLLLTVGGLLIALAGAIRDFVAG
jgi:hypothetical protein